MAGGIALKISKEAPSAHSQMLSEPEWVRKTFIGVAVTFLTLVLFVPLVAVFIEAAKAGVFGYFITLFEHEAFSAIKLTALVILFVIPLNTLFGLVAAWAITKFDFYGKSFLISLIDLPFAVSPVISGLIFVQMFGRQGWFGSFIADHGIQIIFSTTGCTSTFSCTTSTGLATSASFSTMISS